MKRQCGRGHPAPRFYTPFCYPMGHKRTRRALLAVGGRVRARAPFGNPRRRSPIFRPSALFALVSIGLPKATIRESSLRALRGVPFFRDGCAALLYRKCMPRLKRRGLFNRYSACALRWGYRLAARALSLAPSLVRLWEVVPQALSEALSLRGQELMKRTQGRETPHRFHRAQGARKVPAFSKNGKSAISRAPCVPFFSRLRPRRAPQAARSSLPHHFAVLALKISLFAISSLRAAAQAVPRISRRRFGRARMRGKLTRFW